MTPVRTCVGCRRVDPAAALVRLAVVHDPDGDARVVADRAGRLPGRGAWIHADPACVATALRRRPWTRAFRLAGPVDDSAVQELLRAPL